MSRLSVVVKCFLGSKDHGAVRTGIGKQISEMLILYMRAEIIFSFHALVTDVTNK